MITSLRALSCAGLLAAGAGAHAAITVSFAAGSANVERFFEISNTTPFTTGGGGDGLLIRTVDDVTVDLVVTGGSGLGLSSGTVGFEAEFFIDLGASGNGGGGGVFGLIGPMFGGFRFYNTENYEDTILGGFVDEGVGVIVGFFNPVAGGQAFLSGSLLGPLTHYTTQDFIPIAGFNGFLGDSAFTLTNFLNVFDEGADTVAFASGSFSGSFIPSTGTGVLSLAAFGVVAGRRRR